MTTRAYVAGGRRVTEARAETFGRKRHRVPADQTAGTRFKRVRF